MQGFYKEIIKRIKKEKPTKSELSKIKLKLCKKYNMQKIPNDYDIFIHADEEDYQKVRYLHTKPGRTSSGVAVVALMTKPSKCPHGKCTYCPGGPDSEFGDVPQSYTGKEPASMRGERNNFDPYLQVFNRLEQYTVLGHNYDKAEVIVMGGTFPSLSDDYKRNFVGYTFKAFNDFSDYFFNTSINFSKFKEFFELPGEIGSKKRVESIQKKALAMKGETDLKKEQEKNESSKIRCVALCIETRPDYCKKPEINDMLDYGCTRVELGVQSLNNNVLEYVERGHKVEDSIYATKLLKDSLFKVGYHMMPGLPLTSEKEDSEILKRLFSDDDFRPDALKIYPCMVMPGTKLHKKYLNGDFVPMTTQKAERVISEFKEHVPEYCRIMRVQRDIPTKVISAGVDRTNLRQRIHRKDVNCRCIRCREPRGKEIDWNNVEINEKKYKASGGEEYFISAEQDDTLIGFCRLRILNEPFREELHGAAGIRELHVYGKLAPIHKKGKVQHRGIGKKLMNRAEQIGYDKAEKIAVISGVGVRGYYRKLGYKRQGPYMIK